jgi:hypothetical protein
MTNYLIINKPAGEIYEVDSLENAARIVAYPNPPDIIQDIEDHGRFDYNDCIIILKDEWKPK